MKTRQRFFRFCTVGIINTMIDTTAFVGLRLLGLPLFFANFISTSLGITASYTLNTRYTFKASSLSNRHKLIFLAVTLFGLWVIQPIMIKLMVDLDGQISYTSYIVHFTRHATVISNIIPKLSGVGASMFWNYLCYSRIIFK
jgi:putative flippase GtrA